METATEEFNKTVFEDEMRDKPVLILLNRGVPLEVKDEVSLG